MTTDSKAAHNRQSHSPSQSIAVFAGALFAVLIASCGSDGTDVSVTLSRPTGQIPSIPEECVTGTGVPDSTVLANEILSEQNDDLVLDRAERNGLAAEIEQVLSGVRSAEPLLEDVHPIPQYSPILLSIGLPAEAMDVILDSTGGEEYVGPVLTGLRELDRLNARLGLRGLWILPLGPGAGGSVSICLNDLVNMPVAAEKYADVESADYAETSGWAWIGPPPDMAIEQVESTWYLAAKRATCDRDALLCFSFEYEYFRVSGDSVEQVSEEDALRTDAFVRLRDAIQTP
ncbi:MAG: hypothetical protein ACE5FA_08895 [Dehalococcoidia bacterium]